MADVTRQVIPALLLARMLAVPAVRLLPLSVIVQRCTLGPPPSARDDVVAAIQRGEAVLRRIPRSSGTCLTRSIARLCAGRRAGLALRFVLGVRRDDAGAVEAHAWLELDGALFMEADPNVPCLFAPIFSHAPGAHP